ncbi:MAG: flagellar brake domain-containing protein, partial [bacterium]|nr:flagellar brake domain-containing protein [bacterium]
MTWVLKIESYGPVLKMLSERETTDNDAIFALLIAVASIPLLLFIAYGVRKWLRRRNNISRGHAALEKLVDQKNLNYLEQVTVEHLAQAANLQNAAQILTSIHVFDQAVAAWMQQVQKMPWLEMEEQVERLSFLRKTLGFRYLSADRLPTTTRELMLGQNLYMLAGGSKNPRLLSTSILDLDDLAIRTGPFEVNKRPVNVKKNQDGWVFFWTETGKEYRFKTRILKTVQNPAPYLVLQHG